MNSSSPIRVLITQHHDRPIARSGLRRLLEGDARFVVAGEAGNGEESLRSLAETQPQIVLLDAATCDEGELQLVAGLVEADENCPILVLTATSDVAAQRRAVAAGAMGLVQQSQTTEVLFRAVECVCKGEIWIERAMAASVLREKTRTQVSKPTDSEQRIDTLTEREREVITLICQGMKNQAIAQSLFVSEATVRHRLTSIFEKLKVSDRLELVIFSYQHGLAELARV